MTALRALVRQSFIGNVKSAANVYRCDMVKVEEIHERVAQVTWKPAIWKRLEGIPWGQVTRDSQQTIFFAGQRPLGLDMDRAAERINDLKIIDTLVPNLTPGVKPEGHLSYAHTVPLESAFPFTDEYSPFGGDPDWTHTRSGSLDTARSTLGTLYGGISCPDAYVKDSMNPMATADYSAEATLEYISAHSAAVIVRAKVQNGADTMYMLNADSGRFDILDVTETTVPTSTTVASFGGAKANNKTCRLEVVGTILKAYHDGENEILSASDATISGAFAPGVFVEYHAKVDDFVAYVAEVASGGPNYRNPWWMK